MLTPDRIPTMSPAERTWAVHTLRRVMLADGRIDPAEDALLAEIATGLGMSTQQLDEATPQIHPGAHVQRFLLTVLFLMAHADGTKDPSEEAVIHESTKTWGVTDVAYAAAESDAKGLVLEAYLLTNLGPLLVSDGRVRSFADALGLSLDDTSRAVNVLVARVQREESASTES